MKECTTQLINRVAKILDESADYAGQFERERFHQDLWSEVVDGNCESPIEQALLIAMQVTAKINYIGFCEPYSDDVLSPGLYIGQQVKIGKYRVDFLVEFYVGLTKRDEQPFRRVIVECDGTAFHERNEKERRYEKARDRFMQKQGHKIFRYTGKEILDNPFSVAKEIIGYITNDEEYTVSPAEYFE